MPPADNLAVSVSFGALLFLGGASLAIWHFRDWSSRRRDPQLAEPERHHLRRQLYRRSQVAGLLILLGIGIPAGDIWLSHRRDPKAFAWYVAGILVLCLWLFALAGLDWLATQAWNRRLRSSLRQLERKRHELESEAARLRQRKS